MKTKDEKSKGWIVGAKVSGEVFVRRDGEKVVVAKYDGTRLLWKESYQGKKEA